MELHPPRLSPVLSPKIAIHGYSFTWEHFHQSICLFYGFMYLDEYCTDRGLGAAHDPRGLLDATCGAGARLLGAWGEVEGRRRRGGTHTEERKRMGVQWRRRGGEEESTTMHTRHTHSNWQ